MTVAPDYIEPIVGWRSWLVVREEECFRLRSVLFDALWLPRKELVARCLHRGISFRRRKRAEHAPPGSDCRCGIYAASEPEEAACYLDGRGWADALSVHRVIGTVSLWGRVVECRRGWRASHAYPKTIYVPSTRAPFWLSAEWAADVALALTDYDVRVELLDERFHGTEGLASALQARSRR